MKDEYIYPAIFDCDEAGNISISFPDLPGCFSCAESGEEARSMARDAMRSWLSVAREYGEEIAEPTPLEDVEIKENQHTVIVDAKIV